MAPISKLLSDNEDGANNHMGRQIRGFGFQHDGTIDTIERFISTTLFRFVAPQPPSDPGNPGGFSNDPEIGFRERRAVEDFLLAFDSNLAPIVGQQVTVTARNIADAIPRVQLLIARAAEGECDLILTAGSGSTYLFGHHGFRSIGRHGGRSVSAEKLARSARNHGKASTLTCLPPATGMTLLGYSKQPRPHGGHRKR
ncbi:hypothetical protein [Candidatus Thiosymbion oneisti]|uniref:hypothetical protein n=1 Tax=Candidatus Thiosymbion oneisti TaxID=589554 RepID=UPI00114CE43D|nr:hypothetical protein [Candidatus Thiosymbion oneisti]